MKHPVRFLISTLAVMIAAGASIAQAQNVAIADVPFAFRVGAHIYQPGTYQLRPGDDEMTFTVIPPKGKDLPALVLTRLAEPDPPLSEGKLVFDRVGDVSYLSEIWIPGSDGYLVYAAKGQHAHVKVKLTKRS